MYSKGIAYFLWFIGGFGAVGLHRFYLKKFGTGLIWFFTGGLGMFGAIYDLITLGDQVEEENLKLSYSGAIDSRYETANTIARRIQDNITKDFQKEPVEQAVLKVAKSNNGLAVPATVSLQTGISIDEATKLLDRLVEKGIAELRVNKSGHIVYLFQDLVNDFERLDLEDF